jgi:hypothetical protein
LVQFGGKPLTYKKLLDTLRARLDCTVTLQAEPGIMGLGGALSGALYYAEKQPEKRRKQTPSNIAYSYIEVFHDDTIVTPNRLRTICNELDLDEDELRAQADELP